MARRTVRIAGLDFPVEPEVLAEIEALRAALVDAWDMTPDSHLAPYAEKHAAALRGAGINV